MKVRLRVLSAKRSGTRLVLPDFLLGTTLTAEADTYDEAVEKALEFVADRLPKERPLVEVVSKGGREERIDKNLSFDFRVDTVEL